MNTYKYTIGDLIQMKGYEGVIGVVVDIKWNGNSIHIQWLNKDYPSQRYVISYLDKWAKILNCGPIQNP